MKYTLECEREKDGRFLAEVPEMPGVLAYGNTADEARAKAEALALRVLAELRKLPQSKLTISDKELSIDIYLSEIVN